MILVGSFVGSFLIAVLAEVMGRKASLLIAQLFGIAGVAGMMIILSSDLIGRTILSVLSLGARPVLLRGVCLSHDDPDLPLHLRVLRGCPPAKSHGGNQLLLVQTTH